jgi:hypothetical protein
MTQRLGLLIYESLTNRPSAGSEANFASYFFGLKAEITHTGFSGQI